MKKERKELLERAIDWNESFLPGEIYDLHHLEEGTSEIIREEIILNIKALKLAIEVLKKEKERSNE